MNSKFAQIVNCLLLSGFLFLPQSVLGDQTDDRLKPLFDILKSSSDDAVLAEVESTIWKIWFESGEENLDEIMEQASQAVSARQLDQAEEMYSEVIEQAPEFSEAWNRRATVRYYRKDYIGSLRDIQRTLILEPRHFGAIWGLGMILGSEQDFSGAISAFERLLEIKPNARDARPRIKLLKKALVDSAV